MKIAKAVAVLALGGLTACGTGGSFDIGGLEYNGFSDSFSGLPDTAPGALPFTGTAFYVGGYSATVKGAALSQGAATMTADFAAATASLNLLGDVSATVNGQISGTQIIPVAAGGGIMTGQFYNPSGEVAAGRFELDDKSKGQYIVERTTACAGGICP